MTGRVWTIAGAIVAALAGTAFVFLSTFWQTLTNIPLLGTGQADLYAPLLAGHADVHVVPGGYILPATALTVRWFPAGLALDLALSAAIFAVVFVRVRVWRVLLFAVTGTLAEVLFGLFAAVVPPRAGDLLVVRHNASVVVRGGSEWIFAMVLASFIVVLTIPGRRQALVVAAGSVVLGLGLILLVRVDPQKALASARSSCGYAPIIANHTRQGARYAVPHDADYQPAPDSQFFCTSTEAAAAGYQRVHFPETSTDPVTPADCRPEIPVQLELSGPVAGEVTATCKRPPYTAGCSGQRVAYFLVGGQLAEISTNFSSRPGSATVSIFGTAGPYDARTWRGPATAEATGLKLDGSFDQSVRQGQALHVIGTLPCAALLNGPSLRQRTYP